MPAFLLPWLLKLVFNKWTWIALALAGAGMYIAFLRWESAHLEQQRDEARQAAEYAAEVAALQRKQHDILVAAVDAWQAKSNRANAQLNDLLKEIAHAPVTHECAKSPAVQSALDGLRQLDGAQDQSKPAAGSPVADPVQ